MHRLLPREEIRNGLTSQGKWVVKTPEGKSWLLYKTHAGWAISAWGEQQNLKAQYRFQRRENLYRIFPTRSQALEALRLAYSRPQSSNLGEQIAERQKP